MINQYPDKKHFVTEQLDFGKLFCTLAIENNGC